MTFDIKRFSALLKTELRENPKQYIGAPLIALSIILGIVIWTLATAAFDSNNPFRLSNIPFLISLLGWIGCGIGVCIISASMMFANMKTRAQRISTLMLPASTLEKFLVRWILYVPLSIVIFYGGLFAIDGVQYVISCLVYPNAIHYFASWDDIFYSMPFMLIMLSYQSFFCLGSSIWPKNGALHTILWIMGLNLVSSLVISLLIALIGHSWQIAEFLNFYVPKHIVDSAIVNYINGLDGQKLISAFTITLTIVICSINYILAYFRFKENEIIDRW